MGYIRAASNNIGAAIDIMAAAMDHIGAAMDIKAPAIDHIGTAMDIKAATMDHIGAVMYNKAAAMNSDAQRMDRIAAAMDNMAVGMGRTDATSGGTAGAATIPKCGKGHGSVRLPMAAAHRRDAQATIPIGPSLIAHEPTGRPSPFPCSATSAAWKEFAGKASHDTRQTPPAS